TRGQPRRAPFRVGQPVPATDSARAPRMPALERSPEDPLRLALHVGIRGIEEIQPALQRPRDDAMRLRLRRALAEVHRADHQRDRRSLRTWVEVGIHALEYTQAATNWRSTRRR